VFDTLTSISSAAQAADVHPVTFTAGGSRPFEAVPAELRTRRQWVVWRKLVRKDKATKVPFRAELPEVEASTTDPSTWSSFDVALAAYLESDNRLDGIGFVFTIGDGLAGVDFDNCLDEDGNILEWARSFIGRLVGYAEVSPSGKGIKAFVRGDVPGGAGRKLQKLGPDGKGAIEVYDRRRYFTITGRVLDGHGEMGDDPAPLAELHAELFPPKAARKRVEPTGPAIESDDDLIRRAELARNGGKFSALMGGSTEDHPSKSEADLALCSHLAFWTGGAIDAIDRIFRRSRLCDEKWMNRSDYRERTIAKALDGSKFYDPAHRDRIAPRSASAPEPETAQAGVPPTDPPEDTQTAAETPKRIPVEINTRRFEVVERAINAVAKLDRDIYRRGESLVTVIREENDVLQLTVKTSLRGVAGTPKIITLSDAVVGDRLTRSCDFIQWRKDKSGNDVAIEAHPPDWLIKTVATRKHWPGIRLLASVAECPFPRPDGTIVEEPGYDRATATLYMPSMHFPKVPRHPTRDDARAAWDRIRSYFRYFPFASEDDAVVTLAAMFNIIARPAVVGAVPGVAINGNRASTGKGILVDGVTIAGTGRTAPAMKYPQDPTEAGKLKTSIVRSGKLVVSFDNLPEGGTYGGADFDSLLTAMTMEDRILGQSETTGEMVVRIAPFVNGVNISPGKDAFRRWMVSNLITELENPEQRDDIPEGQDLRALILENRAQIVLDLLTILQAHAGAHRPTGRWAPLGSFEEWDRVVRGAVWFATDRDCCATQFAAAADSPDRRDKVALLEGWRELPGGKAGEGGVTTAEALDLVKNNLQSYQTLRGVFMQRGQKGQLADPRNIGKALSAMYKSIWGGLRLIKNPTLRHGAVPWMVESTGGDEHTKPSVETLAPAIPEPYADPYDWTNREGVWNRAS